MSGFNFASELNYPNYWLRTAGGLLSLVLLLSVIPITVAAPSMHFDKFMHLIMYLVPAGLIGAVFRKPAMPFIFVGLTAYGSLIEVIQHWLPWRSGDWVDIAANALGVFIGLLLVLPTRAAMRRVEVLSGGH